MNSVIKDNLNGNLILIVEDDRFLADLLKKKLEDHGAEVLHATDGESALKILSSKLPTLVIIDILLPGMDGFATLEKIRLEKNMKDTPVLLLTNLETDDYEKKTYGLGKVSLLTKSDFNLDELVLEISKVIKG